MSPLDNTLVERNIIIPRWFYGLVIIAVATLIMFAAATLFAWSFIAMHWQIFSFIGVSAALVLPWASAIGGAFLDNKPFWPARPEY